VTRAAYAFALAWLAVGGLLYAWQLLGRLADVA
jgi:hypothetical protein